MPCYQQIMPPRRRYTADQKAEAVRLVRESGLTPVMVAHQLDIPLSTVCSWVLNAERAERAEQPDAWARRRQLLSRRIR